MSPDELRAVARAWFAAFCDAHDGEPFYAIWCLIGGGGGWGFTAEHDALEEAYGPDGFEALRPYLECLMREHYNTNLRRKGICPFEVV